MTSVHEHDELPCMYLLCVAPFPLVRSTVTILTILSTHPDQAATCRSSPWYKPLYASVRTVADVRVRCCIAAVRLHIARATWDGPRANRPKCTLLRVFLCTTQRMAKMCVHETKQDDFQVHLTMDESNGEEVTHGTVRIVALCLWIALAMRWGQPCGEESNWPCTAVVALQSWCELRTMQRVHDETRTSMSNEWTMTRRRCKSFPSTSRGRSRLQRSLQLVIQQRSMACV